MGNVNPAYNDRVRYTMYYRGFPPKIVDESMLEGWDDDDKEYARNKDYDGIFAKFSNNIKFYDEAREFINLIRSLHGINARIKLTKQTKDQEEKWVNRYSGELDMSEWGEEDGGVTIKFNSSDLEKTLKSRRGEKIEIETLEDLEGNALEQLNIRELELSGRRVFLDTRFNILSSANQADTRVESNAGNTRNSTVNIPLNLFSKSHDNAHSTIPQSNASESQGTTGIMFFANNDRDRILDIDLSFSLDAFFQQYENVQWCFYKVSLVTYQDGVNYNVKTRTIIDQLDSGFNNSNLKRLPRDVDFPFPQFTKQMSGSWSGQISLLENESLALECYLKSDMYSDNNAGVRCFARNIEANLSIKENSYFRPTLTKGVFSYELFDRIISIITSRKNIFKSSFLGRTDIGYENDGVGAFVLNSHGHWIRRFSNQDDLYKRFTTSFRDAYESYDAAYNLGLGVESIGFGENIRIEDKKYFWNPNVTIRLGKEIDGEFVYSQVSKVKRSTASQLYYSEVEIGSEKGGDYEEVMGLEETNTKSNFSTCIYATANTYDKKAKYRFDPYGEEIIRRRGVDTHPNTDHPADLDVWMHDCKKPNLGSQSILNLKKWQDVLESRPTGMFDPDSSYNFLYSPLNMLLRHSWVLNAGLREYPSKFIKYGSSTGNSSVSMKQIGGKEYAENGNIRNSDLQQARFKPEEIEFEYEVDDELIQLIESHVTILGIKIPRLYGLIEFMNEKGQIERGYLLNLKPNKSGKWKLLKANR